MELPSSLSSSSSSSLLLLLLLLLSLLLLCNFKHCHSFIFSLLSSHLRGSVPSGEPLKLERSPEPTFKFTEKHYVLERVQPQNLSPVKKEPERDPLLPQPFVLARESFVPLPSGGGVNGEKGGKTTAEMARSSPSPSAEFERETVSMERVSSPPPQYADISSGALQKKRTELGKLSLTYEKELMFFFFFFFCIERVVVKNYFIYFIF
jgi:hypothetical protein